MKFFRTYWVYFLIGALPFERIPSIKLPVSGHDVTIRLSYLIAVAALLICLPRLIQLLKTLNYKDPRLWMLAYLFVAVLSSFGAASRSKSLIAIVASVITVGTALLVSTFEKELDMELAYKVLLWVSIAISLFALYQFFGDSFGLSTHWTGLREIYTKRVFGFPRVQATALEPLYLGNFLMIPLALAFARSAYGRLSKLSAWALFIISVVITMTLSRGAYFGTAPALGTVVIFGWKYLNKRKLLDSVGLIIAGCLFAIGTIFIVTKIVNPKSGGKSLQTLAKHSTTVSQGAGAADGDRGVNRQLALQAFKSRPLLGYGIGNFGTYAETKTPAYAGTKGAVIVNNEYLEVLAETGLAGFIVLLGFFVTLVSLGLKAFFSSAADDRIWILAFGAIIGGFVIQYYAFSTLYIMHIWVTIGLLLALSFRQLKERQT